MKFNRLELEEIKLLAYSLIDTGEAIVNEEEYPNLVNKISMSSDPDEVEAAIEFILMEMVSELTGIPVEEINMTTKEDIFVSEVIDGAKSLFNKVVKSTKEAFSEENIEDARFKLELGIESAKEKISDIVDIAMIKGELAKDYLADLKADYEAEAELSELERELQDMNLDEDEEAYWTEYWNGYFEESEEDQVTTENLRDLLKSIDSTIVEINDYDEKSGCSSDCSHDFEPVYMTALEYLEFLELKTHVPSLFEALLIISESPDSEFHDYLCGGDLIPRDEVTDISDIFIHEFSRAWEDKNIIELEK